LGGGGGGADDGARGTALLDGVGGASGEIVEDVEGIVAAGLGAGSLHEADGFLYVGLERPREEFVEGLAGCFCEGDVALAALEERDMTRPRIR
jgi:hypothetical protein